MREIWSLTSFRNPDLSSYAGDLMYADTRKGMVTLAWVLFALLAGSAGLYFQLGYASIYVYSASVLAVLSLHMAFSVRAIRETRVLYLLATTLIVIIGVAVVLLAHNIGEFNIALLASIMLLFLVMPLVPWGLREATLIVLLVYLMFTMSTLSVQGRFDAETLWVLQFVMLGAGLTTLVVIARNTMMRKQDIEMRFQLEQARDQMKRLSQLDPLTGAWNRRFLERNFDHLIARYHAENLPVYFVTIDINDFKPINDNYGHAFGDLVLKQLVRHFQQVLEPHEHLIRMGGDEFAALMTSTNPEQRLNCAADSLLDDPAFERVTGRTRVHVSMGVIEVDGENTVSLGDVYRRADEILYRAKQRKHDLPEQTIIEMKAIQ